MSRQSEPGWLERLRKLIEGVLAPTPRPNPVPVPVPVRPSNR